MVYDCPKDVIQPLVQQYQVCTLIDKWTNAIWKDGFALHSACCYGTKQQVQQHLSITSKTLLRKQNQVYDCITIFNTFTYNTW